MRRDGTEKALGPYKHGARWRVITVSANGKREYARESEEGPSSFASREAAEGYIAEFQDAGDERTVASAVDEYLAQLRARGLKSVTVTTTGFRLRGLLRTTERDRPLQSLTPAAARGLLERRIPEVATETQVGELAVASRFARWCVAQGWIGRDPFAELEAVGARGRGKAQLRIDEARVFVLVALDEGDERGLAAAIALLMGLRASEITNRVVRDVDDGARVLWIDRAKTRKG